MEVNEEFVNKVAASGIITFNLEDYLDKGERLVYDIKDNLFHGLILKEKDFRAFIKEHNWQQYSGKNIAIICSTEAIVPTWAYMLLANRMKAFANEVVFGNLEDLERVLFTKSLSKVALEDFRNQRVVIKGCSNPLIPIAPYLEITNLLSPIVKSIMYGEPCSTVPIYKKKD